MSFLDVHFYDGKLLDHGVEMKNSREEILKWFVEKTFHHRNMQTIYRDRGTFANYDPSNHMNVEDILVELYENIEKKQNEEFEKDALSLLLIQLDEMDSGMCPQGRTHRTLAVLKCFQ